MSGRPTALITGAGGFIGSHLARLATEDLGHRVVSTRSAPGSVIDLETPGAARDLVLAVRPELVLHAAAISSLDACQADPARARRVNTAATIELADAAREVGARFVFLSTDQVFDGAEPPYRESSATAPLHVYGETKRDAEEALLGDPRDRLVLRLALVYGPSPSGRRSAHEMVVAAEREGRELGLFVDEYRCPVSVRTIGDVIRRAQSTGAEGLVQVGGKERVSRYELGLAICGAFGLDPGFIRPARLAETTFPVPRPADLTLEVGLVQDLLGHELPELDAELARLV